MSTSTASTTKVAKSESAKMLAEHERLISLRKSAEGSGPKMVASKKLAEFEVRMIIAGVSFESWSPEPRVAVRKWDRTEDELRSDVADLQRVIADSTTPPRLVSTATQMLAKLTTQCEKRSIKVPAMAI